MLPNPSGPYGILPPSWPPYRTTFDEIEDMFVNRAPSDQFEQRSKIMGYLRDHADAVAEVCAPNPVLLWINGGFATHKSWKAPQDADVVYFVSDEDFDRLQEDQLLGLWTLFQLSGFLTGPSHSPVSQKLATRVQPMLGRIDAFVARYRQEDIQMWAHTWSGVKDKNGIIIENTKKGFLEVHHSV